MIGLNEIGMRMGLNVIVKWGAKASESEWRTFLAEVRRELFLLHRDHAFPAESSSEIGEAPLSYQEDLYGLTPAANFETAATSLVSARASHPNFFTSRARYRRLQQFETDCEWIVQTAGSIMDLGRNRGNVNFPDIKVKDAPLRTLPDLGDIQRRIMSVLYNLMLMLDEIDLCAQRLAGAQRWRSFGRRRDWGKLDGTPTLSAAREVYETWLGQYRELLSQRF